MSYACTIRYRTGNSDRLVGVVASAPDLPSALSQWMWGNGFKVRHQWWDEKRDAACAYSNSRTGLFYTAADVEQKHKPYVMAGGHYNKTRFVDVFINERRHRLQPMPASDGKLLPMAFFLYQW